MFPQPRAWGKQLRLVIFLLTLALLLGACRPEESPGTATAPDVAPETVSLALPTRSPSPDDPPATPAATNEPLPTATASSTPRPAVSPTPDPTRPGQLEPGTLYHVVQYGENLGRIAEHYGMSLQMLMQLNGITNPDLVHVGQTLLVSAGALPAGPADKLIPDSELVYGPAFSHFDVATFLQSRYPNGYLLRYTEELDGRVYRGPEIVQMVAQQFSVGPRLLLALLELKANWITEPNPPEGTLFYPMGKLENGYDGLYIQLCWTANQLNRGYYGWQAGWLLNVEFADDTRMQMGPTINAGTAGVQAFLALHNAPAVWELQVSRDGGLAAIYRAFFGDPFTYAVEPLIPAGLTQPEMALPWEAEVEWFFTSGPHGGWGSYSGWAALDFVPGGEQNGCYDSDEWVRAAAPGRVLRAENGEVMVDLDDDGFEGTGWALLYMHIASRDRVPVGTWLEAGDKIGHPSCEGGFSDGTHVHIARRYNGRWMEADGPVPFVMDGWTPTSYGREYDGALVKGDLYREAWGSGRDSELNGIIAGP